MIFKARKGQTSYGELIGILLLDTNTPFIQGDVGNATSYQYPVRFQCIDGLTPNRIFAHDQQFVQSMIRGAQELEREGVKAITGDCGFMAIYQQKVQEAVHIPVFLTSLLQLPFITSIISPLAKVGIVTANSQSLNRDVFSALGITNFQRVIIAGLEQAEEFKKAAIEDIGLLNSDAIRSEVVQTTRELQAQNPDLGALLLECSMLPPYAAAVQESTGLPVFDYLTLIDFVASSFRKNSFHDSL
ncbi:MAG: aspartate/glutamate racemase family protein [Desulfovermiculus sp.]